MESHREDLEKIKQFSNEMFQIEQEKDILNQQLNQYRHVVTNHVNKITRTNSLLSFDRDLMSLTESTDLQIKTMEMKIQQMITDIKILSDKYDDFFEKRKTIVQRLDTELNKTITYIYPFGTEKPTIRMGRFYHITEYGDVMCELKYESNSFFDETFRHIV